MVTWFVCNLLITVAVYSTLRYELDPVLHLGHPGIHTVAGALYSIAHHSDLGKSKSVNEQNKLLYLVYDSHLPFSDSTSGPPESPWQESLPLSPAQMWNLNNYIISSVLRKVYLFILYFTIPLNFAWVIVIALFIRHHSHLHLLEC